MSRRDWADLTCSTCRDDYDGATAVELGEIGLAQLAGADVVDEEKLAHMLVILGVAYADLGDAKRSRELMERALTVNERTQRFRLWGSANQFCPVVAELKMGPVCCLGACGRS